MKHVFIINPCCGRADPSDLLIPQIQAAAQTCGIEAIIEKTTAPRHAIQLAREYAAGQEPVRLYACGGDGTLNEVIQGAAQKTNVEIACVPCGSGNDFVRNFGSKEDFLDIAALINGTPVSVDLMKTQWGNAVAICSAGLDAQVAYGIPKFRRIPFCGGTMAYNLSIVQNICGHLGHQLRIQVDDEEFEENCLMVAVCNGRSYGGGYTAAPDAQMDDGLLDVLIVRKISRLKIASVVAAYKQGQHFTNGEIRPEFNQIIAFRRGRKVTIEPLDNRPLVINVDGECGERPGLQVEILPKAGRIVLPQNLAANFQS